MRSTSDCAVLLRSWRTKDGGITRELSLFEWWGKSPKGKEGVHLIKGTRRSTLVEEEQNTYSKRTYKRNLLIRSASRKAARKANAELDVKYK